MEEHESDEKWGSSILYKEAGERRKVKDQAELEQENQEKTTDMSNIEQPQPVHGEYDVRDLRMPGMPGIPPVMTPVDGIITDNNVNGALNFRKGFTPHLAPYLISSRTRQNSNTSLASSVSEMPGAAAVAPSLRQQALSNTPLGGQQFSPQFVALLMEAFQVIAMDPTVTPFDSANPPSAILNRVAKLAIGTAAERAIDIGFERNDWLLTLVRQRLLQEVRKDGYLSRNASLASLPAAPMFVTTNTVFQPGNDGYGVDYFNYNFAQLNQASTANTSSFVGTPTGFDNLTLNPTPIPNPSYNVITRQRSSTLSPLPQSTNATDDPGLLVPDFFKRRMERLKLKR